MSGSGLADPQDLCKTFKSVPKHPNALHKLDIFSPINKQTPWLIWILCKLEVDEDDNMAYQEADISHVLGEDFLRKVFITHGELCNLIWSDHFASIRGTRSYPMYLNRTKALFRPVVNIIA